MKKFNGINGPGIYKTREGKKVVIRSKEDGWVCWEGDLEGATLHWDTNGRYYVFNSDSKDIIDYWQPEKKYLTWCEELTKTMRKEGRDTLTILLPEEEYDELELELGSECRYRDLGPVWNIVYQGVGASITFVKKQEKHMTKKISLDGIDEMDALCEKGRKQVKEFVTKLVTQMGHEVESEKQKQPELKAGQVWKTIGGGTFVLIKDTKDALVGLWLYEKGLSCLEVETLTNCSSLLANSLEEYFAKKVKGEL